MHNEESNHERAKQVARKFLQSVCNHDRRKDDNLQEMCRSAGVNYNKVYHMISSYVEEKDYQFRNDNPITAYCLNDEGRKFSEKDFDFDSLNANTKNEMVKETVGGNHKTCQIDSRPLVSILSFEKKTFIQAQGDNTHVDMSDSRRPSFWDLLPDVIKRLLGKL